MCACHLVGCGQESDISILAVLWRQGNFSFEQNECTALTAKEPQGIPKMPAQIDLTSNNLLCPQKQNLVQLPSKSTVRFWPPAQLIPCPFAYHWAFVQVKTKCIWLEVFWMINPNCPGCGTPYLYCSEPPTQNLMLHLGF